MSRSSLVPVPCYKCGKPTGLRGTRAYLASITLEHLCPKCAPPPMQLEDDATGAPSHRGLPKAKHRAAVVGYRTR